MRTKLAAGLAKSVAMISLADVEGMSAATVECLFNTPIVISLPKLHIVSLPGCTHRADSNTNQRVGTAHDGPRCCGGCRGPFSPFTTRPSSLHAALGFTSIDLAQNAGFVASVAGELQTAAQVIKFLEAPETLGDRFAPGAPDVLRPGPGH